MREGAEAALCCRRGSLRPGRTAKLPFQALVFGLATASPRATMAKSEGRTLSPLTLPTRVRTLPAGQAPPPPPHRRLGRFPKERSRATRPGRPVLDARPSSQPVALGRQAREMKRLRSYSSSIGTDGDCAAAVGPVEGVVDLPQSPPIFCAAEVLDDHEETSVVPLNGPRWRVRVHWSGETRMHRSPLPTPPDFTSG